MGRRFRKIAKRVCTDVGVDFDVLECGHTVNAPADNAPRTRRECRECQFREDRESLWVLPMDDAVWCQTHGEIHARNRDPYEMGEPECNTEVWRDVWVEWKPGDEPEGP